jgi:TonB family protein
MSVVLHRRPSSLRELGPFLAAAALILLLIAIFAASLWVRTEQHFTRMGVGERRILEQKIPVKGVRVLKPEVASAELDPNEGLIVHSHRPGLAEVIFDRADGKRFHYFVQVRGARPIRMTLSPSTRRKGVRARGRTAVAPAIVRRVVPPVPKKEPEVLPEARPKGQVVEIDKPKVEERPETAKYLSEYNSKVREETRARVTSPKRAQGVVPPSPPLPPQTAKRAQPSGGGSAPKAISGGPKPTGGGKESKTERLANAPSLPKVALAPSPEGRPHGPGAEREGGQNPGLLRPESEGHGEGHGPGEGKGDGPGNGQIDVTPRPDVIAQALGGAAPDHLKGVKEGEQTFLNTKEWKGASFFNRVKRAVAQHWNPGEVYRRRDPTGNIYGIKDRYTLVQVTLFADGSLKDRKILKPSGIDFLDEEAMGALEAAQPFPNPPPQIQDRDGLIRFAFGFYFEISDRPLFKIYRYGN